MTAAIAFIANALSLFLSYLQLDWIISLGCGTESLNLRAWEILHMTPVFQCTYEDDLVLILSVVSGSSVQTAL